MASMGLTQLLHQDGKLFSSMQGSELAIDLIRPIIDPASPHAPRPVHFDAKAKQVLMIFAPVPSATWIPSTTSRSFGDGMENHAWIRWTHHLSRGTRKPQPEALGISDRAAKREDDLRLTPHIGSLADDLCFIHSLTSETNTHGPGENFMCTGFTLDGFPSIGAWTTYALGSEQTLPAYGHSGPTRHSTIERELLGTRLLFRLPFIPIFTPTNPFEI